MNFNSQPESLNFFRFSQTYDMLWNGCFLLQWPSVHDPITTINNEEITKTSKLLENIAYVLCIMMSTTDPNIQSHSNVLPVAKGLKNHNDICSSLTYGYLLQ